MNYEDCTKYKFDLKQKVDMIAVVIDSELFSNQGKSLCLYSCTLNVLIELENTKTINMETLVAKADVINYALGKVKG